MNAADVIAYAFDADLWCPECCPCPCGGADPCSECEAGRDGCCPVFGDAESDSPETCGHCGEHLYGPEPGAWRDREGLTAALVAAGVPHGSAEEAATRAVERAWADDACTFDLAPLFDVPDDDGAADWRGAVAAFEDREWAECIAALRRKP